MCKCNAVGWQPHAYSCPVAVNARQENKDHRLLMEAVNSLDEDPPCANNPEAYFPEKASPSAVWEIQWAKTQCAQCPIKAMCADYGVKWQPYFGIWGGLTVKERQKLHTFRTYKPRNVA